MLRAICLWPTKDHEVAIKRQKTAVLLSGVVDFCLGLLLLLLFLGATDEETLHEGAVLVHVLDGEGVVWAWPLEQLVKVIEGALGWCSAGFSLGGGHERAPTPFLVLLIGTVGGAFISVFVPLRLASGAIKNCSNCLLVGSVAGHDVEEFRGSPWALTSQLMDQGLVGGP